MDSVRSLILKTAKDRGLSLADLSRRLGKNHSYIQQYVTRGIPRSLPKLAAQRLAEYLGVDVGMFGIKEDAALTIDTIIVVPWFARFKKNRHPSLSAWPFPLSFAREQLAVDPSAIRISKVSGNDMAPMLKDGDVIAINTEDHDLSLSGIFAIESKNQMIMRRMRPIIESGVKKIMVLGDNVPSHIVETTAIRIVGRIVWYGRKIT